MEYLLKASAVVVLFYLCFYIFLKRETFFQHNRWFLFIGLLIALVFPFIVIPIYIPIEPIVITEASYVQTISSNFVVTQAEAPFDWNQLIPIIYGIGFTIFSIQFVMQFGSLALLLLKNPKYKDELFTYVIVENKISPFSFFKWIVYNPDSFENNELDLILTHEKVHAKQLHSIDILLAQIACVIFWFNPLIWLYRKEVRQNLEYIADFKTQIKSKSQKEYQRLLLKTSVANHNRSLSNNFYNSLIKERIVMLKKSRSNTKKQWRYLLMLPLLAGLLMSMNTETIYVEINSDNEISANKEKVVAIITKDTKDAELETILREFKQNNIPLNFEKIERNNKNEITYLDVRLYDANYGDSYNKDIIQSFIIYKELFDYKGVFIGRIDGASVKFEALQEQASNEVVEPFLDRAYKAILKSGIQTEKDLETTKKLKSDYDHQTNTNNFKHIEIVFINTMTDQQLDEIKKELQSHGITMTINSLKRNTEGEIKAINIDFKTKNGATNYTVKSNKGIAPFYFNRSEDGRIGVGAHKETEIVIVESLYNSEPEKKQRTFLYHKTDGEMVEIIEDTITSQIVSGKTTITRFQDVDSVRVFTTYRANFENDSLYLVKGTRIDSVAVNRLSKTKTDNYSQHYAPVKISSQTTTIHAPAITKNTISKIHHDTEKPIIIVDGKVIDYGSLKNIDPENIESMTVLKGKAASEAYGEKGKNGVIIIKMKDANRPEVNDSPTIKEEGPWKIGRTEVTSLSFVDDENPSKNSTLAFITKYTSDAALDTHISNLEKFNIEVKFSKVRRNQNGEITSIKISLKNNKGNKSSASWKDDDGIPGIEFGKQEGALVARTSAMN